MPTELEQYYVPPSLRDKSIFERFLGAIQTRIADRQKALWSRFIGAGFIFEDIENCWPEENMRFFSLHHGGTFHGYNLSDLNLRELDELEKWIKHRLEFSFTQPFNQKAGAE